MRLLKVATGGKIPEVSTREGLMSLIEKGQTKVSFICDIGIEYSNNDLDKCTKISSISSEKSTTSVTAVTCVQSTSACMNEALHSPNIQSPIMHMIYSPQWPCMDYKMYILFMGTPMHMALAALSMGWKTGFHIIQLEQQVQLHQQLLQPSSHHCQLRHIQLTLFTIRTISRTKQGVAVLCWIYVPVNDWTFFYFRVF